MTRPEPTSQDRAPRPAALHEHAAENLRFIRATMEGATAFTALSGKGYVIAGGSAFLAAWIATRQTTGGAWFNVWIAELLLATVICLGFTWHKARRQGTALWSASSRRLLYAFIPTMAAAGLLTLVLYRHGEIALLPGTWLALYGAAVISGGMHSVRVIPRMGLGFLVCGALALFAPGSGNLLMALGFGGLHIVFGWQIWRHHGG